VTAVPTRSASFGAALLFGIGLLARAASAESPWPPARGPESVQVMGRSEWTGDLRLLPVARPWQPGDPVFELEQGSEDRFREIETPPAAPSGGPGGAKARSGPPAESFARTGAFPGQSFTGSYPPDTTGDVGPAHYVQLVNAPDGARLAIFDKATGALVAGPIPLRLFGTGPCSHGFGDPMALYDHLAGRWLFAEVGGDNLHSLCVYLSSGSDPSQSTYTNFRIDAVNLPDYPKLAVWPDAYWITTNEQTTPGVPGSAVYAMDRRRMLSGSPASVQRWAIPGIAAYQNQALTPADLDGPPPPRGTPGYLLRHHDDEVDGPGADPARDFLDLWTIRADFGNPANSALVGPVQIAVSEFDSSLCGIDIAPCIPQPTTPKLWAIQFFVMHRLVYRADPGRETLLGNFTVDADGADRAAVRWFELRRGGASSWALFQEGSLGPPGSHRWVGAIGRDRAGDVALIANASSATYSPSVHLAARRAADPAGTLPLGEDVAFPGSGGFNSERSGDYAAMGVDPVDGCTFWYSGEAASNNTWTTGIAWMRLAECAVPPPPTGRFFSLPPCRVLDTRIDGPSLLSGVPEVVALQGVCGIPASAVAVAANVTITGASGAGFVTFYPGNSTPSAVATLNWSAGQTRTNNAILSLSTDGLGTLAVRPFVEAGGGAHLIVDVAGYFE
jgi:hypothetical protein